jgi:hypothetical protein
MELALSRQFHKFVVDLSPPAVTQDGTARIKAPEHYPILWDHSMG